MTYQIINHGHSDTSTQVSDGIAIAAKIGAGVTSISAPILAILAHPPSG